MDTPTPANHPHPFLDLHIPVDHGYYVEHLRSIAAKLKIDGYRHMRKDDLIREINHTLPLED